MVPLVEAAGETISSSHIRGLVAAGEVGPAAEFLGGPFLFEGEVVPGDRRGRELGMPTANIVPDEHYVVPGHGVYAAWAHGYPAAVNVGVRPTFDTGRGLLVEAHLIGFDGDIYGETLRIAFLERLRGEKRFDSVDELVEQMNRDVDEAKRIAEARPGQVAEAGRLQRQLPVGVVLVAEHAAVAELDDRGGQHVRLDAALAAAHPNRADREQALVPEVAQVGVGGLEHLEGLGGVGQEPPHSLVADERALRLRAQRLEHALLVSEGEHGVHVEPVDRVDSAQERLDVGREGHAAHSCGR